jgi:tRNA threonylcarbamoyladenosine biosynthesis protein TsaE
MVFPVHVVTHSAEETAELGKKFGAYVLKEGSAVPHVICCSGDLGSGKTTFVQGFARGLGITSRLPSPTFIIVRRYPIAKLSSFLYHFDLYRLQNPDELSGVGFAEMIHEPQSVAIIEWPERMGNLLPRKRIDIRFAVLDNGAHAVAMTKYDR